MTATTNRAAVEHLLAEYGFAPTNLEEWSFPNGISRHAAFHASTLTVFAGYHLRRSTVTFYLDRDYDAPALDEYLATVLLMVRPTKVGGSTGGYWSVYGLKAEELLEHLPTILRLDAEAREQAQRATTEPGEVLTTTATPDALTVPERERPETSGEPSDPAPSTAWADAIRRLADASNLTPTDVALASIASSLDDVTEHLARIATALETDRGHE